MRGRPQRHSSQAFQSLSPLHVRVVLVSHLSYVFYDELSGSYGLCGEEAVPLRADELDGDRRVLTSGKPLIAALIAHGTLRRALRLQLRIDALLVACELVGRGRSLALADLAQIVRLEVDPTRVHVRVDTQRELVRDRRSSR